MKKTLFFLIAIITYPSIYSIPHDSLEEIKGAIFFIEKQEQALERSCFDAHQKRTIACRLLKQLEDTRKKLTFIKKSVDPVVLRELENDINGREFYLSQYLEKENCKK
jgi:hypothetical protein